MRLLHVLLLSALALGCFAETGKSTSIRGKLTQRAGKPPALETADHKLIALEGDEATRKVLNDKRLNGFDLEARGHFNGPDRFAVDPIHSKAMLVHKNGHRKLITYWCDTCAIRTFSPGVCVCCQEETTLDLRDPDQP